MGILGGTVIALIHPYNHIAGGLVFPDLINAFSFPLDIDANMTEGFLDKFADGMCFVGGDGCRLRKRHCGLWQGCR